MRSHFHPHTHNREHPSTWFWGALLIALLAAASAAQSACAAVA